MRHRYVTLIVTIVTILTSYSGFCQDSDPPSVLIVTAHPDDDAMFAATVYRITHALGGTVDLALITDGAGGYRFSTLSEEIYGLELTDETIARQYLPAIRKQELMRGGSIVGIRNYFFIDQPDLGKTEDADSVMKYVWDTDYVADRLDRILANEDYDYILTMLPIKPFHAHHKAATIFALEAVERLAPADRPVILGSFSTGGMDDIVAAFTELEGHPLTRIRRDVGPFIFDRGTRFGTEDRLNYTIVVNWLIAEHKSQGTMQMLMSTNPATERFWLYDIDPPESAGPTAALFEKIQTLPLR